MKRLVLTITSLLGCGSFILASAAQMDIMKQDPVLLGAAIFACIVGAVGAIRIINTEDQ